LRASITKLADEKNIAGLQTKKKRLQSEGVDSEILRLLCRHLVKLQNTHAEARWWTVYNGTKAAEQIAQ
jgi:hypothetical protein